MEEKAEEQTQPIQPEPTVSFPEPRREKKGGEFPKWIFAVIGLVIIIAAGGFFLYQTSNTPTSSVTPTPYVSGLDTLPTPSETPISTKTPVATQKPTPLASERALVSVKIENGTGTTGDAALAKAEIEKVGYTKLSVGNAQSQSSTETVITYSQDVSVAIVNELTESLSKVFDPVRSQSATSGKMSVTVTTGPKKSAANLSTSKPTATPVSKATSSPSPTPKGTSSASPVPTRTP